jgi:hypothetical protein
MATEAPETITVDCETCGEQHVAEASHRSQFGGHQVYAAVCPSDYLTDYYTEEAAR